MILILAYGNIVSYIKEQTKVVTFVLKTQNPGKQLLILKRYKLRF